MKRIALLAATLAAFFGPVHAPAYAKIKASSDNGFNIVHSAKLEATPDEIWKRLLTPKSWWNKAHSWSGKTDGFYLDAQANGCFCELFQETQANGKLKTIGSVEHMRVIFAQPGKVLRMRGALGPLQSEAVIGTLTVAMEPLKGDGDGAMVSFSYVVGGYMRYKSSDIGPVMDKVIGQQFAGLIKPFDRVGAIEEKASSWTLDLDGLDQEAPLENETSDGQAAESGPVDGAPAENTRSEDVPSEDADVPRKFKFIKEGKMEPR